MRRDPEAGHGRSGPARLLALIVALACVSFACSSATPSLARTPLPPGEAGAGMTVTGAEAMPVASNGTAVSVAATIRNGTARDDRLPGATAPGAQLGALYGTCACIPAPVDPATGLVGKSRYPSELIRANDSIALRFGAGELILTGIPAPVVAGQTIAVTFQFETSADVTVEIPVVAGLID